MGDGIFSILEEIGLVIFRHYIEIAYFYEVRHDFMADFIFFAILF